MACESGPVVPNASPAADEARRDGHSYANVEEVRVNHIDLDLTVAFDERLLRGTATLTIQRITPDADELILDTRELVISQVEVLTNNTAAPATYQLGDADAILGAPLSIYLPAGVTRVRVTYETSPTASGLKWLEPEQTTGKQYPFLFTQSQAIHARSWIPLQDSPAVRVTYAARIETLPALRAVMSATNVPTVPPTGIFHHAMPQAIPSYLIALAVGELAFIPLGERAGVYAEPSVVEAAAAEFADTESMIQATERLYGPYRWGRYDLLVLPPSFPFGGMENPRLTFTTPTILSGDKSLVSLVAHELAHSWSGNLVTNATWRDFWLNEGFTTYIERRILEEVYGKRREEMEAMLGHQALREDLDRLDDPDEILHVDLTGRDPDEGMTQVPYEKGALFLRQLEETIGRERFDELLRGYFDRFAFQSVTTADFVAYLREHISIGDEGVANRVSLEEWIRQPGLPATVPQLVSDAFRAVEQQADVWVSGEMLAAELPTASWTTQEWLHFLKTLPVALGQTQLVELDTAFGLTESSNAEIAHFWLLIAIRNGYAAANVRLESYLVGIGRRKLIRPLYEALAETPDGREQALAIYRRARPGYHAISTDTIDEILGWEN